jgi:hypothetical protein
MQADEAKLNCLGDRWHNKLVKVISGPSANVWVIEYRGEQRVTFTENLVFEDAAN